MRLTRASLALCAVLALAAAPAAAPAQNVKRPPAELWDEFPLEPSPSASPAAPQATGRSPRAVPVEDSDRVSRAALIALLLGAAATGAVAKIAVSRGRARRRRAAAGSALTHAVRQPERRAEPAPPLPAPQSDAPVARTANAGLSFARAQAPTSQPEPAEIDAHRSTAATGTQPAAAPAAETGRPVPKREPPAAAPEPGAIPTAWDTCEIKLHSRSSMAHFYAVPSEGGPVLARSPDFNVGHAAGDDGPSPREALRALVEELTAAGWRQTGAGSAPWDLRFRRSVPDRPPFTARRSG